MCGICGYVSLKDKISDKNISFVKSMAAAIRHRGPDHTGYWNNDKIALGNPRLSVIDLSENGNLPMSSATGDVWLCYNGEVSNFKELSLKYKLREKFPFKSTTDTEVLIYLYKLLGIGFLNELSGMFAFCLVDLASNKVFIVRDFYGILPVFVHSTASGIYFASEIKALLEIEDLKPTINKTAIHHFFSLAYIPAELTPFNEITELKGGELIEIDLNTGALEKRRYYEFVYEEDFSITADEAILKTRELLISAVERNLVSDAPLGMTLSGGIDTSAMLGIVKHLGLGSKMNTFSLKMGEKSFDESPYQQLMAKYAGSIHHEILVSPDEVIENMLSQIAHTDEPNGNGACIPSFILAKKAAPYVKVLLSGEGGDELFNAYPTIGAYQYRKLYRNLPSAIRKLIAAGVNNLPANYSKLSFDFKAKRFTAGAELDIPDSHLYWRHVFTEEQKKQLLVQDYAANPTVDFYKDLYYNTGIANEINRLSLIDMKHFFIDDLMVKNDRTFLANSVEGRFPFMDRMLVDYVTKLPVKYRVNGFNNLRWVEKEAMKPFMPAAIYKRGGFGLEMPHSIWFGDKLGKFAATYINKAFVEKTELLNWEFVERIWKIHQSGKQDYGRPLWCILNFLIWFDLFVLQKNSAQYRVKR
jgi:asparagine synthase (glutamine-hydrolysing)